MGLRRRVNQNPNVPSTLTGTANTAHAAVAMKPQGTQGSSLKASGLNSASSRGMKNHAAEIATGVTSASATRNRGDPTRAMNHDAARTSRQIGAYPAWRESNMAKLRRLRYRRRCLGRYRGTPTSPRAELSSTGSLHLFLVVLVRLCQIDGFPSVLNSDRF